MGAGSFFGLPTAIILLCACCTKLAVGWFVVASLLAALAACEAVTSAYYLLNWREFWDEIVEEIKKDSEDFDQELADRVYEKFEDYEFFGYICIGVAVLWILCAMLICFFAGSYKRFLREQTGAAAVGVTTTGSHSTAKAGNADGIEQPRHSSGGNLYREQAFLSRMSQWHKCKRGLALFVCPIILSVVFC
jgi:hypothetical protein